MDGLVYFFLYLAAFGGALIYIVVAIVAISVRAGMEPLWLAVLIGIFWPLAFTFMVLYETGEKIWERWLRPSRS